MQEVLSHPSLQPSNLTILPGKKAWIAHLDLLILSDSGNILDALFLASAAALHDTRVPRTRSVEYKVIAKSSADRLASEDVTMVESGLDTRSTKSAAADFELVDYWDEGEPLKCEASWPLCITLNLVSFCTRPGFTAINRRLLSCRPFISWMRPQWKKMQQAHA